MLKDNEINFSIEHFYDRGLEFKLGDHLNGWIDEDTFESFDDGVTWLWLTAQKHFPDADCFQ